MQTPTRILFAAAIVLVVIGLGLAIFQPGDLGDEDATADDATTTTSTTALDDATSTTTTSTTTSTTSAVVTTTTAVPDAGDGTGDGSGDGTADPTTDGSGAGADGAADPADTSDGLPSTGGTSFLLAGLAMGGAGLVAHRRTQRRGVD